MSDKTRTLRVIFIDDDKNTLNWLKRELRPLRNKWNYNLFSSASEAFEFIKNNKTDVLVSDLQMPGFSGHQLLKEVKKEFPNVLRIILSGMTDQRSYFNSLGIAHQFLSKPCRWETIRDTIESVVNTRNLLCGDSLQNLISDFDNIPVLPDIYMKIQEEIRSPDCSIKKVGGIIEKDPGLTAQILRIVNSAYFGLKNPAHDPVQATVLMGLETVKSLVLALSFFSHDFLKGLRYFSLQKLWHHSFRSGLLCRNIAKEISDDKVYDETAFIGGLFHDIGKAVLAANKPEQYDNLIEKSNSEKIPLHKLEYDNFGVSHAEVGAIILSRWGFSFDIIEAIATHHREHNPKSFPPETISGIIDLSNKIIKLTQKQGTIREVKALFPSITEEGQEKVLNWINFVSDNE